MKKYPTKEELKNIVSKLPEELRDVFFSEETGDKIMAIGKKYGLALDKIDELYSTSNLLILGYVHPGEYVAELSRRLQMGADVIKNIAQEVNEQIFSKIRESLKKIHGVENETSPEKKEPTPATGPQQPASIKKAPLNPGPQAPPPFLGETRPAELGGSPQPPTTRVSPFEQKLEPQTAPIKTELEQAKKESRYPQSSDPYKEPPITEIEQ